MNLSNPELETVLRCVDKVFDFSAERDRLRDLLATLEAENKGLAARVAELEARCKRLEEAGDNMLEALYTPEPPRCVCNRSYPCDDCVNYSSARDAKEKWQQAKEAKP